MTFALLVLHIAEEAPAFPAWVSHHFGTTTPGFYALSHIPLLAGAFYVARRAAAPGAGARWVWLSVAVQVGLAGNGLFHLATTILFREYSPGVITGVVLYMPFTAYLLTRAMALLPASRIATASLAGGAAALVLIASLWLDLDFV